MDVSWLLISLVALFLISSQADVLAEQNRGTGKPADDDSGRSDGSAGQRAAGAGGEDGLSDTDSGKELEIFQKLFLQKRSQQLQAIQEIFDKYSYEQTFKLVEMLFDRMQEILAESREKLTESGFEPGMPFPTEQETKEGLSLLLENLVFFGDITLRLPDITHSLYSKKKQLRELIRWSTTFTEQSGFLDENHKKLINLMSQELRLIKRDPNYVNPFKKEEVTPEPVTPKKKKEKKPKKRGPRVSRAEL